MRQFEIVCPYCGNESVGTGKKVDTDLGIMDEMFCDACEAEWDLISSVHTQFIRTDTD